MSLLHCPASDNPHALARGVAQLFPSPVRLLTIHGDYLEHADRARLIEPLLRGETVVLLALDQVPLVGTIADMWAAASRAPGSYSTTIGPHGHFSTTKETALGLLVVVQVGGKPVRPYWGLEDDDVATLEAAGGDGPVPPVGRPSRAGGTGLTIEQLFREVCLLHLRDEPPVPADDASIGADARPLRWSDVQRLLVTTEPWRDHEVIDLHGRGLIDRDKRDFYLAALDELHEHRPAKIRSCVWEAVWVHLWREKEDGEVFRGQASAAWRLDNTLLRLPPGRNDLDAGTLERRLRQTDTFVRELGERQTELLGTTLNDDELVAVAQHYGFPTPFLDFTRSLKVAAFFASVDARRLPMDGMVGVIHCFRSTGFGWSSTSVDELQELGVGGFRLLPSAGLRVGAWRVVEPRVPGAEDRIGRQRGLFIADYNVRDLQHAARDAIFFHQHDGDVFEDSGAGITEGALLEARTSRLSRLAESVTQRLASGESPPVHPVLARVSLPDTAVVGGAGAPLQVVLSEAEDFFSTIGEMTETRPELAEALGEIFQTYFRNVRLLGDAGQVPEAGRDLYDNSALQLAAAQLEGLADLPAGQLGKLAKSIAPRDDPTDRGPAMPYATAENQIGERSRIATGALLYLVGWEHLVNVYGFRARAMSMLAREVLGGYRTPWE